MQVQIERPEQVIKRPQFKIGIVGADGLNPAWSERETKTACAIHQILDFAKNRNGIARHDGKMKWIKNDVPPYYGFYSWNDCKPLPVHGAEIVLVSGHCPVGQELEYCIDCKMWLKYEEGLSGWSDIILHGNHRKVKVYDKGGVDTMAEIIATELGIEAEIYPAICTHDSATRNGSDECKHAFRVSPDHYWLYHYRPRNIKTANAIPFPPNGVLYDIEPKGSCKHCGGGGYVATMGGLQAKTCNYCGGTGNYSGGTWTLNYAKKLGKETHMIVII